jgi:hypothetical protein
VGTAEVVESVSGTLGLGSRVVISDGLERTEVLAVGTAGLVVLGDLEDSRHSVLKTTHPDDLLGHSVVGGNLVFTNSLDELESWLQGLTHQRHHFTGNGSREHECLTVNLRGIREESLDLLDIRSETLVKQTVCLVKNQGVQLRGRDTSPRVRKNVLKTSRGTDEQVAALALNLHQARALLGTTNSSLHNEASAEGDLLGLDSNLFGQFTGRGDDKGADFGGSGSGITSNLGNIDTGIIKDVLKSGEEESKSLSSSCLGLGKAEKGWQVSGSIHLAL